MLLTKALFLMTSASLVACSAVPREPGNDGNPGTPRDAGAPDSAAPATDGATPPHPPPACVEGASCDDGNGCTTEDRCRFGRCQGTPSATCGFEVQEWGTYTSVQASDGHAIGGVHHVDEALPTWVHSRNWNNRNAYFFEELPEEPMQQLETPVLYFWSPTKVAAHVKVDFPKGVVGEWFPDATTFAPAINACTSVTKGTMTWDVTVDPAITPATFPAVSPTEIWAPSRNVGSTPVRFTMPGASTHEDEQFIFYRGLGTFVPAVHVVAGADGQLRITNSSAEDIAAAFVLHVTGSTAQIVPLGALHAGETRAAQAPAATKALSAYVTEAQTVLQASLVTTGLKGDVAKAMVDTWTRSWFKNEGLRVLYLAPRAWTDAILPMEITPKPSSLVRTLVGRVEIISASEETQLVAKVRAAAKAGATFDLSTLGRFSEPRLRRTLELLTDPTDDRAYAQKLIDQAHDHP